MLICSSGSDLAPTICTNGWTFTSQDSKITKTIILTNAGSLRAGYTLGANVTSLFVRFGLSPDLEDLLTNGQLHLQSPPPADGLKSVSNINQSARITTGIRVTGIGLSGAVVNPAAIDDAPAATPPFISDAINMRNQALVEQIEIQGNGTAFTFELELAANASDLDRDGLPDDWEIANGLSQNDNGTVLEINGPNGDPDMDGVSNQTEWLVGMNPQTKDNSAYPKLKAVRQSNGSVKLEFPILSNRRYRIWQGDNLRDWSPILPDIDTRNVMPNPAFERFDVAPAANQTRRFYRLEIAPPIAN